MGKIENKRRVTAMDTVLSKEPLDESDPGYQQPEPKEEGSSHTNKKRNPRKKQYNAPLEKDKEEEKEGKPDGKQRQDKKQENKKAPKKPFKPRDPKEPREPREHREPREPREPREQRNTKDGKYVDPKHRPNLREKINEEKGDTKPRRFKENKRGGGKRHEGRPKFNDDFDIQHKKGQRPPPDFYPGPQGPGYFGPRGYDAPYPRPYRGGYYGDYGHDEFMGYPPHRPMQGDFYPGPPRFEQEQRRGGGGPREGGYREDPRDGMPPRGHPMGRPNPPREHMRGHPMRGGHSNAPDMPPPDMMRGFPMRGRGGMRGGMMRGGPPSGGQPFRGGMPMRGGMRGRGQPPAGGPYPPKDEGPREQATVHKRQRGGAKQYNN
uniref:Uncharacterized protein n=1 Tax=Strombidium inclinatum TaxID=197538 RepID=A0A7S3MYB5_9SPIT|mmetsp:Transcript_29336/g.44194  ORF Transcript_29336/g.44194 Transcript_29336/m.44194 type:complete len:377 (+) Transcript_29336:394-1524(+)